MRLLENFEIENPLRFLIVLIEELEIGNLQLDFLLVELGLDQRQRVLEELDAVEDIVVGQIQQSHELVEFQHNLSLAIHLKQNQLLFGFINVSLLDALVQLAQLPMIIHLV